MGKLFLKIKTLYLSLKVLFTGEGAGNRKKFALAGKDAMEAFSNMTSDTGKTFQRPKVDMWDMTFTAFETDFGELHFMYCEMLDVQGKSDEVLILDPEYMRKRLFKAWSRETYDMKKLAVRDTEAVVLTETSCIYLTNENAHSVLKLDKTPVAATSVTLNRSTVTITSTGTVQLVATVHPSYAANKAVTWVSGTPAVATVDNSGLVTALTEGTTVITVTTTDGSFTDTCTVTVAN